MSQFNMRPNFIDASADTGTPTVDVQGFAKIDLPARSVETSGVRPEFMEVKYNGLLREGAVLEHWHQSFASFVSQTSSSPARLSTKAVALQAITAIGDVLATSAVQESLDDVRRLFHNSLGPTEPDRQGPSPQDLPGLVALDRSAAMRAFFRISHVLFLDQDGARIGVGDHIGNRCLSILAATALSSGDSEHIEKALAAPRYPTQLTKGIALARELSQESKRYLDPAVDLPEARKEGLVAMRTRLIGSLCLAVTKAPDKDSGSSLLDALVDFGSESIPALDYLMDEPALPAPLRHQVLIKKLTLNI